MADEQTAGRGRAGRRWVAPAGGALLLSVGFRPTWLEPERAWRLAAVVSLAMAEAAESIAGLPGGRVRLKWPNDLVIEGDARPSHARSPACWVRPMDSARPTRGSSSGSASTPIGPPPTSRPTWPAR